MRMTPPWTPENVSNHAIDPDASSASGRSSALLSLPGGSDVDMDHFGSDFNLMEYLGLSNDDDELDAMLMRF